MCAAEWRSTASDRGSLSVRTVNAPPRPERRHEVLHLAVDRDRDRVAEQALADGARRRRAASVPGSHLARGAVGQGEDEGHRRLNRRHDCDLTAGENLGTGNREFDDSVGGRRRDTPLTDGECFPEFSAVRRAVT